MEAVLIRGALSGYGDGSGSGSGDGYGDGYGSGDGYGDGYGSGDGYGYGYGDGYGSGDGYGYGYGYGDGYGSGDGSGDGYGYGSGDGYGYGYGSGDGYGYGDGYGDGYGSGEYWAATIDAFALKWNAQQQSRLGDLRKIGSKIAFWRSDKDGRACNGGKNAPVYPGLVETSPGPLSLCAKGTLHATLLPPKWQGDRWWVVALTGQIIGDDEKFGALSREIIGECL